MRDTTQDFFIDGIHDELIARLNQIPGLDVISRTSALRYRDTDKTTPEIARELDVDAVLESSVLWSGDSMRIQVQLIDAFPRERHMWQETYDEPYREIRVLHSQVALAVAKQIHATLMPEQRQQLATSRPVNPIAHQALLRARHSLNMWGVSEVARAIGYLEQAIAADSSYAEAYAWLSRAYDQRGMWFGDLAPSDAYPRAINAVQTALRFDSSLAYAHAALRNIRFRFLWDWGGADASYQRALELDPGSAEAHADYSNFLRAMGRHDEGLFHAERAMELNPVFPGAVAEAGMFYRDANQQDLAEAAMERALEFQPGYPLAYWVMGSWRLQDGDLDGAIEMLEREGVSGFPAVDGLRAVAYARKGEPARAQMLLDSLLQRPYMEHWMVAGAYAALGYDSLALDWLERAVRDRDAMAVFTLYATRHERHPLSRLQNHPRFQAVLEQMAFP